MKHLIESFKEEGRWSMCYRSGYDGYIHTVFTDSITKVEITSTLTEAGYKGVLLPKDVCKALKALGEVISEQKARKRELENEKTLAILSALYD